MPLDTVIPQTERFDIQPLQHPHATTEQLRADNVAFVGAPMQHPHREESILLVTEVHGSSPLYYEFRRADIAHIDARPNITDVEGRTVAMARVWVRKGSIAMRYTPFIVADLKHPGA
jgi:hypothetical protein